MKIRMKMKCKYSVGSLVTLYNYSSDQEGSVEDVILILAGTRSA